MVMDAALKDAACTRTQAAVAAPSSEEGLVTLPAQVAPVAGVCVARIWAGGRGAQCSRKHLPAGEYCPGHVKEVSRDGLPVHGRIDGPVPQSKLAEFRIAGLRLARQDASEHQRAVAKAATPAPAALAVPAQPGPDLRWSLRSRPHRLTSATLLLPPTSQASSSSSGFAPKIARRDRPRAPEPHAGEEAPPGRGRAWRCVARAWSNGQAAQCSRQPLEGSDRCLFHRKTVACTRGLAHGRIDEPALVVPPRVRRRLKWNSSSDAPATAGDDGGSCGLRTVPAPQPPGLFSTTSCQARIWGGGRGAQCSKNPAAGSELCKLHLKMGLSHGRIDGVVPACKAAEFLHVEPRCRRKRSRSEHQLQTGTRTLGPFSFYAARRALRAVRRKRLVVWRGPATNFDVLSEVMCVQVFAALEQFEIFLAASSCRALRAAASAPQLYRRLDLRAVGRMRTSSGRRVWLAVNATVVALNAFVAQARFSEAVVLDLRDKYLGDDGPEGDVIFDEAARHCPRVSVLLLGRAGPLRSYGALEGRLPASFARRLRGLWRGRSLTLVAYGRTYFI